MTFGRVVAEAVSAARGQPVASSVTIFIIAAMCLAVLLTSGRTVGAQQAALATLDSTGTRSIIIQADPAAGLRSDVLERLGPIEGIAWTGAFGPATDVHNAAVPGGPRVALRKLWTDQPGQLGLPIVTEPAVAWASPEALEILGMPEHAGGVVAASGESYAVMGRLSVPGYLKPFEPLMLAPASVAQDEPVTAVVIIAERPDLVATVAETTVGLLEVGDSSTITVITSTELAAIRGALDGLLGGFGRELTLLILGLTGVLAATVQFALVMMRRKDFGRRRALGASQRLIVTLLVSQVTILSVAGATFGTAAAVIALLILGDPPPGPGYTVSVAILAVVTGAISSAIPAIAASRRDPIVELRVP